MRCTPCSFSSFTYGSTISTLAFANISWHHISTISCFSWEPMRSSLSATLRFILWFCRLSSLCCAFNLQDLLLYQFQVSALKHPPRSTPVPPAPDNHHPTVCFHEVSFRTMIELDGCETGFNREVEFGNPHSQRFRRGQVDPSASTEGSTCSTFPPMLSYFFLLFPLPLVTSKPEFQDNVSREESAREW